MHTHSYTHTTGSENGKAGIKTHTDIKRHKETHIPWAPVAKMKFYISFAVISLGNLNPKP
jgi:hypothetical protein